MKKKRILSYFLSLVFAAPIFCETINFQSSSMSGNSNDKNSVTILEGNAKVSTETMIISADKIELSGKDYRFISATGNVKGQNLESKMDFTCGTMKYDRESKIASLENDVSLTDTENEVTAQAQIIEYNQESELAVMQINVSLTQKNNKCTSAYAVYKKNEQLLEMSGNPQIVQGADTFRAQNISLNLKTQEIKLSGRVKGSVSSSSQESPQEQEKSLQPSDTQKPEQTASLQTDDAPKPEQIPESEPKPQPQQEQN